MKQTKTMDDKETWIVPVQGQISIVEFLPYDWASSLLAVGTKTRIIIFKVKFKEEYHDIDDFAFEIIHEVNPGAAVTCFSWSPETSIVTNPPLVKFASACVDKNIRLITSSLSEDDTMAVLEGHSDCINDVSFEPDHGMQLASTSDDCTCRIWNQDGTAKSCFTLNSAGMAVRWHREDVGKIMVAQKTGVIRFYNVDKEQPIMSIETCQTPLMSADWCPANPLLIGAVAGNNFSIWDISKSSQPLEQKIIHNDGALKFLWNKLNPNIFASAGRPKHQIKVTTLKENQNLLTTTLTIGIHMSWHSKLSVLACAGDNQLHLYKL